MKSNKRSGESKLLSPKNRTKNPSLFSAFSKPASRQKRTVEQEINRMREMERKKAARAAAGKKDARTARSAVRGEKKKTAASVRVISLGGLGEIGKNMTVVETAEDLIVIDCGMGFPDDGMLGIDLVIPDVQYLEANKNKIRGVFLTHGHEDHIGAIPYLLRKLNVPLYGTKLTLGIVENKLTEFTLEQKPRFVTIRPGDTVRAGSLAVEAIAVNHSIADSVAFAVHSPVGNLIFTGDFKIDSTPIAGEMTDLTRFGELGREGVTALFCDSTNCERPGFAPSERTVGTSLKTIFRGCKKRIIVATFSSNIHRVQQIIDESVKCRRAVCILGRSMINIVSCAAKLGYMRIPDGTLIEPEEIGRFAPKNVTLITTGSQGEAMSALSRMAFGTHNQVKLGPEDMVVISAHPIPGNEKTITNIINELMKKEVEVVYDRIAEVHASGHACQEEIKLIFALTRPRFFMPLHGEYKHLACNAQLAQYAGIPADRIFISEIGKVLEIYDGGKKARFAGTVPSGKILVDGFGVGDVGSAVLRDRKLLSEDGVIIVAAAFDVKSRHLIGDVQIFTRGFVYVRENEDMMEEIRILARRVVENTLLSTGDPGAVRNRARDELSRFLFERIHRRPMILPAFIEL